MAFKVLYIDFDSLEYEEYFTTREEAEDFVVDDEVEEIPIIYISEV